MAAPINGGLGGRSRLRGAQYQPMSEINVTPLVDVMLVLLVVFMVTAPLLTVGVPVDLLQRLQAALINEPKEPTVITVNKDGVIFIQKQQVAMENLIPMLTLVARLQARSPAANRPMRRASTCAATRTSITARMHGGDER